MTTEQIRDFSRSLPMALLKARETIMLRFRPVLNEHGITEQQWRIIRALFDNDGLESTELAERTLLLLPSLTRIVRIMEEKGWVRKLSVEGDNRRRHIQITAAGRKVHETISPMSEREYHNIEKAIDPDNLETLYNLLDEINNQLTQTDITATVHPTAKIGIGS